MNPVWFAKYKTQPRIPSPCIFHYHSYLLQKDFEVKENTVHKVINDFKSKGIEEELFLRTLTEYALYERGIKFSSHRVKIEQRTIDFYAKENNEFFLKYKNLVSYYSDEEEINYNKNLEDDYSDGNRIL